MEEEGRRSGHDGVMPTQTPGKNGGGDPAGGKQRWCALQGPPVGGGGAEGPQKGNPLAKGPKSEGGGAARAGRLG